VRYASGAASNEFGNFYNRLANLAGLGQTGVSTSANAGANAANQIGGHLQAGGAARANGYNAVADIYRNSANNTASNLALWGSMWGGG
jgi:hypothetical protein